MGVCIILNVHYIKEALKKYTWWKCRFGYGHCLWRDCYKCSSKSESDCIVFITIALTRICVCIRKNLENRNMSFLKNLSFSYYFNYCFIILPIKYVYNISNIVYVI